MLCHIKARRSSRWDGFISRGLATWGRGRGGERRTEGEDGDGWNRGEARLDQGEGEDKRWESAREARRGVIRTKVFTPHKVKEGDGKCFCSSSLHPSLLPPPPPSTLPPLRQFNLLKPYSTDDVTSLDEVSCCSKKKSSFPRWFSCTLEDTVYQRGRTARERGPGGGINLQRRTAVKNNNDSACCASEANYDVNVLIIRALIAAVASPQ